MKVVCSFRLKIGVAEVYVCINIIWSYINIKIYDLAVIYVCVYMLPAEILTHKIMLWPLQRLELAISIIL